MDYAERWEIIDEIGSGGQGRVYRVLDRHCFNVTDGIFPAVKDSITVLNSSQDRETYLSSFEQLRRAILEIVRIEDPASHHALKVLHEPRDARDFENAEARLHREIGAMSSSSHPNLLEVIDHDPDSKWFVSKFYPRGTLADNRSRFAGNVRSALLAIRPLVEGVAELHQNGLVHRDIKPQNIFLGSEGELILGDFGLIYFDSDTHERLSATWENVGSHAWMPGWAMSIRIDEVSPAFDVFSLGKLLWAMISSQPLLPLWYFDQPQFNLERLFPDSQFIRMVSPLLSRCVVEHEADCLPNAGDLLVEIDKTISIIARNGDLISPDIERFCKTCGIGKYHLVADRDDPTSARNFGISMAGNWSFKIFVCDHCGSVQLFAFGGRQDTPPAWSLS